MEDPKTPTACSSTTCRCLWRFGVLAVWVSLIAQGYPHMVLLRSIGQEHHEDNTHTACSGNTQCDIGGRMKLHKANGCCLGKNSSLHLFQRDGWMLLLISTRISSISNLRNGLWFSTVCYIIMLT
ncbi:hypothetical protein PILCRDRAFT_171955 [Piloderma croceum F 1598]|uniref:Uncharacterized protein n=1 Tax=Piloderma croceum (strain F 1598) TaxID=765440 RepID=A0A0C3G1I1_PILCF|nr:hypothetical protein PILCRDRAFT_171955 [Piloderma croceum F 1598]